MVVQNLEEKNDLRPLMVCLGYKHVLLHHVRPKYKTYDYYIYIDDLRSM